MIGYLFANLEQKTYMNKVQRLNQNPNNYAKYR